MLLGARYYDSSVGRFISRDPIGYAGGFNLYGHCGNNPIDAVDPSGLFTIGFNLSAVLVFPGWDFGHVFDDGRVAIWDAEGPFTEGHSILADVYVNIEIGGDWGVFVGGDVGAGEGTGLLGSVGAGIQFDAGPASRDVTSDTQGEVAGFGMGLGPGFTIGGGTGENDQSFGGGHIGPTIGMGVYNADVVGHRQRLGGLGAPFL